MNEIIDKAMELILMNNGYYKDVNYMPVYLFTTENISGFLQKIDVRNKNILTISSSGDHIFNMLVNGASKIDSFDINYFTKYYYYFKESAIKVFSYNEFLNFFFPTKFRNRVFDDRQFFKVLEGISNVEALKFWKELYLKYGGKGLYYSNLFIANTNNKNTYMECNDYLRNEDNYKKLQSILRDYDYNYTCLNLFDDISDINNKYDFIYLSNVLGWLNCTSLDDYALKVKDIVSNLEGYLKEDGMIGVCYLYCYLDQYWNVAGNKSLNSSDVRDKYFYDDYSYLQFNGFSSNKSRRLTDKDGLMLKRVKSIK